MGYVHIGMFVTWLVDVDMLDPDWMAKSGVTKPSRQFAIAAGTPCAMRRHDRRSLASDMLRAEVGRFTGAYYAPEYGYARDWRRSSAGGPTATPCPTSGTHTTASAP